MDTYNMLVIKSTLQAAAISVAIKAVIYRNMTNQQLLKLILCVTCISFLFEMTLHTRSSVEGFDEDPRFVRQNNVLYSGDIVFINGTNTSVAATPGSTPAANATPSVSSLQRSATTSEVILAPPVNNIQSNLSKLRIESIDHDPQIFKPIKYGDTVYIKHNANVNNANTSLFIKISNELISHQTGPLFNQFVISNVANAQDKGYVQPGATVAINNLASGGISSGFLNIDNTTNKITNSATSIANATPFTIQLERVAENNDRHLCIGVGDILYP